MRFVKPSIRKVFGKLVTETPFSNTWVNAIKASIPSNCREWNTEQGTWSFDLRYYQAVVAITQHFFGAGIMDSTGGDCGVQETGWKAKFDAFCARPIEDSRESQRRGGDTTRGTDDPHDVLYLLMGAPSYVIQAVYRAMAARNHPDKGGNEAEMARINAAYAKLKARGYVDG
jgi:hypothetical protein